MPQTRHLRRLLQRDGSLDEVAAASLWGAMLDGAMDDVDVGAMVAGLALAGETREEIAGLHRAARERQAAWAPALRGPAVSIPAYGLVAGEPLLVSLLALLLPRFDVPVVVHGVLDSPCGASSAQWLRELGVMPCATLESAGASLAARGVAFLPVQLFAPALAAIVALRSRMGFTNTAHLVAQALDPTGGRAIRVTLCAQGAPCERFSRFAAHAPGDSLALSWPATSASPFVRPRIERVREGRAELLFGADAPDPRPGALPFATDVHAAARWLGRLEQGAMPLPAAALNLIAACLYAIGRAPDLSRAKALAAVEAGRLAA